MHRPTILIALTMIALVCTASRIAAQAPSSSLLVQMSDMPPLLAEGERASREQPHALRQMSMFAVAPPEPRTFYQHDLVQIIVREQTQARSSHEMDLDKRYRLDGRVTRWPQLSLPELLELRIGAGRVDDLPELRMDWRNRFEGDGDFRRRDDLSSRITAEVIEVLPNGNLIIEARSYIKIDNEEAIMRVTGVCRPDDVTSSNTILSNQIHNLRIEREHKGELRKTIQKGIIPKVLDAVFAF